MKKTFILASLLLAMQVQAEVKQIVIENSQIQAHITPDIGGRLLHVARLGQPNFLRVGEAVVTTPNPSVSPESENVGYLGHEIWVGPQSQWWVQQIANAKRAETKASWPPDPYLILAKNELVSASKSAVVLRSPASPVSGLEVTKSYELIANKPQLKMAVTQKNIRSTPVAWDIWFNSRVHASTQVYIPVANAVDVRLSPLTDEKTAPLDADLHDGIFTLAMTDPSPKLGRKGKVFVQPSQGWMAGFYQQQVFVITFELQPKSAIHTEQGQIELYNDFLPQNPDEGLLEMELHAPYKTLAPGETAQATEVWSLLAYNGPNTRDAHLAFLRRHAKELGINIK